jgi:hypothetical protein
MKKLFKDHGIHGTVILNYTETPEDQFTWYGEAFHSAGSALVQALKADDHFGADGYPPDSFKAAPIVYLYRHAMELYLKAIIKAGAGAFVLRGEPIIDMTTVSSTHSLQVLLSDVERIFAAFGWDWDFGLPHFRSLADFRSIVGELQSIDAHSDAFRYPTKRDGSAALNRCFRFNLFTFCETLDPIYQMLDGRAYHADETVQLEREAQQEAMENTDHEPPDYE